jgi:hypothetical protein
MTDLHDRFRSLDRLDAPDLWSEVTQRAALAPSRPRWGFPPTSHFAPLALAAAAIVLAVIAVAFVRSSNVGPPPIPTDSASPEVTTPPQASPAARVWCI